MFSFLSIYGTLSILLCEAQVTPALLWLKCSIITRQFFFLLQFHLVFFFFFLFFFLDLRLRVDLQSLVYMLGDLKLLFNNNMKRKN